MFTCPFVDAAMMLKAYGTFLFNAGNLGIFDHDLAV